MADSTFVNGPVGRHQCLTNHLSAKHALPARLRTVSSVKVELNLL